MTRCNRCNYNNRLKSSAYNPSGQRHEVQLTTYNAMTNHLRRVLLAKSVVDCGKVDGVSKKNPRRGRTSARGREVRTAKESLSQNVIDRLAYDTKYHPNVVAKMSWRHDTISSRFFSRERSDCSNSPDASDDSSLQDHRVSPKHSEEDLCAICAARLTSPTPKRSEDSGSAFHGGVKESKICRNAMPRLTSSSQISCPESQEFEVCIPRATSSVTFEGFSSSSEVSMYINFVYDMTKEIMDMGFYADEDIEAVFERHFEKNLGRLDKEKMLQEINCLKKALSVNCESENDVEVDAVVSSCERLLCSATSLPGTSGGLKNFKERAKPSAKRDPVSGMKVGSSLSVENKSADIIVTQEDVMNTLLDMDLKPDKAKEIYKTLKNRSKELTFGQSRDWNSGNNTQPRAYSLLSQPQPSLPIKPALPNAEASRICNSKIRENRLLDDRCSATDEGAGIEAACAVDKKAAAASVAAELETKESTDDSRLGPKCTKQRLLNVDFDLADDSKAIELPTEIESESTQDAKSRFDSGQPLILEDK
ncbi:uncharacterized protein LOC124414114 [Diprion similis]|uniref:uncharacterized protein LOC124414114 n=1 Tax=Diprion similis TaxID=362088 RepID=UPI001EF97C75|nr:uncharacterized protein LOC124414114 [Diprion similis]